MEADKVWPVKLQHVLRLHFGSKGRVRGLWLSLGCDREPNCMGLEPNQRGHLVGTL